MPDKYEDRSRPARDATRGSGIVRTGPGSRPQRRRVMFEVRADARPRVEFVVVPIGTEGGGHD